MHLSEFCVKRPVFASVISLLLVVVGIVGYQRLPVREYPDINPPIVTVETAYRGASSAVIDTQITKLLEDRISGIEGIRTVKSESVDGESRIEIEFVLERDIDAAASDVRERLGRVVDDLPEEADPPEIYKVDSSNDIIMWLNLASDTLGGLELTDYARRYLVDPISTVPGVARVRVGGARDYSMRVWLDREAMAARGITAGDIEAALRRENVELPAGRVDSVERYFTVRTERAYLTEEDFRSLVVARGGDGHPIRLAELAHVEIGPGEHRQELRGNGLDMVGLGIIAQSKANTLEVARGVKAKAEELSESLPPGTRLIQSFDTTVFIEQSIREIYKSLGLALVLVVLVIYLFLGSVRAVLVPAVTVPVSLISTLAFLDAMGFSLNLLTLLALLLAIGLVVDDAIIMLENIHRRIHLGESPPLAAVRGAKQVGFAVVATTLVLIAAFVPIGFMSGDTGRLFAEFAFALAASVGFSSLVALTLSPVMCSFLLARGQADGRLAKRIDRDLGRLAAMYHRLLDRLLRHGWALALTVLLVAALAVFFFRRVPSEFAPSEDRGAFFILMKAPEGASFEYAQRYMREVERELLPLAQSGEATRVLMRTPGSFGNPNSFNSGRGIVVLAPWGERRPISELLAETRTKLGRLAGVRAFPVARGGLVSSQGTPVEFVVGGNTYDELAGWRDILLEAAAANPNLLDVQSDFERTKPQFRVRPLRDRADDLGVPLREIGATLETFFGSKRVTTFIERGEEYDVIVQGADADRANPRDLDNLYVRSQTTGTLIPLANLVAVGETAEAPSLKRYNRLRAVTITADLAPGYSLGEALEFLEKTVRENLPPTARIDYAGESRDFKDSQGAIAVVIAFSLVAIFLVLAAQFESFVHPLTILTTVPLAMVGAYFGLYVTGNSLNIFSQIGIVLLVGLAAKNGILIVEFANQLRDRGRGLREAVLTAARLRLRPVLMTAISTVFGALPLLLATGAGAENRFTVGVVIAFGLTSATALTLFVVPAVYLALGRFTGSPGARGAKIDAEDAGTQFEE